MVTINDEEKKLHRYHMLQVYEVIIVTIVIIIYIDQERVLSILVIKLIID